MQHLNWAFQGWSKLIRLIYLICQTLHTDWQILVLDSLFGLFIQKINVYNNYRYLSSKGYCAHVKPCVNLIIECIHMHGITAVILVSQKVETVAILVSWANHVGTELFSYINTFSCSNNFARLVLFISHCAATGAYCRWSATGDLVPLSTRHWHWRLVETSRNRAVDCQVF